MENLHYALLPVTLLLLISLLLPFSAAQLEINEIMYDPNQCPDTDCEWVELYNDGPDLNVSACTFNSKPLNGTLPAQEYLLLVRDNTEFTTYFGPHSYVQKVTFSLSNSGSLLQLQGPNCTQSFNYTPYLQYADGNGNTLERRSDASWGESMLVNGTPGQPNSIWDLSTEYAVIEINEILPNPEGSDDENKPLGEWVELYNTGSQAIDLRGLILKDENDANELYIADNKVFDGTVICAGCYTVVYRDGDTDFTLNNDYDEVRLFVGSTILDSMSYADTMEGMSISQVHGQWVETIPTPGASNTYISTCDWAVDLEMSKAIFTGDDFEFTVAAKRNYGFAQNITVRGEIQDGFGKIIEEYRPWTNQGVVSSVSKDYSPNLAEGVYQLTFRLENLTCTDNTTANNQALALVSINPQYKKNASSITIDEFYLGTDESVEWGEQFTAKVTIYKGDETQYSVQVWVEKGGEKVSKTTKLNIYDKYKEYPLTLPLQLLPNCDQKISDGTATLVVEAFNLRTEKEFSIEEVDAEVCTDYLDYIGDTEASRNQEAQYQVIAAPLSIASGEAFQVQAQIMNDDQERQYQIYGYLYL